MAGRSSKKTQADLIELVKAAGWKEDQKKVRYQNTTERLPQRSATRWD